MKKLLPILIIFVAVGFFLFTPAPALAADLYWVGDAGAATNVASNWKTTDPSGCGSGDASAAPTTTDVAIFDADCDNGAAITGSFSVQGVNMQSGYSGEVTQNAVAMTIGSSGWTQAAGTFTGSSSAVSTQSFNQSGGTFTSTSGNFTDTGAWTTSAGTFTHNSGTVLLNSPNSSNNSMTMTGTATFNNLTFGGTGNSGSGYTITLADSSDFIVTGTLRFNDSNQNSGNGITGNGSIEARGTITTTAGGFGGAGVVTINGGSDQTLNGVSSGVGKVPSLTINKSGGTLTVSNNIYFSNGTLTYTQGNYSFANTQVTFKISTSGTSKTISGSIALNNVVFQGINNSGSNSTYVVASDTTLTVNNLTLTEALSATDSLNGPGTINIQGDLSSSSRGWTGNIALNMTGTNNQSITVSSTSFPTGTFTINKSSGTVTLAADFSVNSSGQDLVFSSGTFANSSYNLTVNDVFSIGGTITHGTGNITAGTYTISSTGVWNNTSTGDVVVGSGGVTNNGQMNFGSIDTCGASDSISITSSSAGTARNWSGRGSYDFYDITVQDQNESPAKGRVIAWSSTVTSNSNFKIQTGCPPPPVAYWKFDDAQGTTAQDATTNNLDGTHNNTPTVKTEDFCVAGKCLWFDGTNNENVSLADNAKLDFAATDNFTVQAWVKRNGASSTNNAVILGKASANIGSTYQGYKLYQDPSGDYCFDTQDGTLAVDSACTSAVEFDDDKWHLVQGVKSGTTSLTLYVDGRQRAQDASIDSTGSLANSGTFYTGIDSDGLAVEWLGYIDEVKVYPYARSSAQVQTDFNARSNNKGASAVLGIKDQKYLSEGLVGYWKMDESSWTNDCSTTSITDSSGNGNNGQACPATTGPTGGATGKFGNTGDLDGSDDFIRVANSSSLSGTTRSIAFWVYLDTYPSVFPVIIEKGYYIQTLKAANYPNNGWYLTGVTGGFFGDNSTRVPTGQWTHYAFVYDGTNMNLYMNGELKTTAAGSGFSPNSGNMSIGTYTSNSSYAIDGKLDEFRIYNRTLTSKEVSDLYTFAPPPSGYWSFDERSGLSTADKSGNGNTGTLTNGPSWTNGKFGASLNFDGSDDVDTVTNAAAIDLNSSGIFTYSAWVYADSAGEGSGGQIFNKGSTTFLRVDTLSGSNLDVEAQLDLATTDATLNISSAITTGTWNHIAVTYEDDSDDEISIYINGVLKGASADGVGSIAAESNNLLIGGPTTDNFDGKIDDFKFYNYARNSKQVVEDMNGGHPAVGSPVGSSVAYWKMDEGSLNKCSGGTNDFCDSTPNGNDLAFSTTTGGYTDSGKFGKAFNGATNLRLSRADDADLDFAASEDFSFSLWFKSDSTTNPSANEYLLEKGASVGSAAIGYAVYTSSSSDGLICFGIDDDAVTNFPEDSTCSSSDIYDGTWHQIVATKTSSMLDLYVDGKPNGTPDTSLSATGTLENSASFYLGDTNATDGTDEFLGDLDEVKVYRYALTSDEVKTEYNRGSSEVLGSLSDNSNYQKQAAAQEYCVPGDSSGCDGTDVPVGRWDFEEKSGTSANDTSGNGRTGTLTNTPSWTTGKIGSALSFVSASSQYVNLGAVGIPNGAAAYTIETWIYPTNAAGSDQIIYCDTEGIYLCLYITGSALIFYNTNGQAASTASLTNNAWQHVALTYNGTNTYTFYLNGVNVTSDSSGGETDTSSTTFQIGGASTGGFYYDGKIDQARVFNYARTAAQIAWDYNRGGPLGHWKMDECQGTTINDSSGNSLTGTLTLGGAPISSAGDCTTNATTSWYGGATGKYNSSIDLDGTDDVIDMNDPSSGILDFANGANFSIEAWINRDTFTTDDTIVAKKNDQLNSSAGFVAWIDDSSDDVRLVVSDGDSANLHTVDSTSAITTTGWNHIVIVYDDSSSTASKIYINGKDDSAQNTTTGTFSSIGSLANTVDFRIGSESNDDQHFDGKIDNVKIYNYALTATQVKLLYNQNSSTRFGPSTGNP